MIEVATGMLWIVGSAFALLAAVGVLRMPDVFTRMQASTKASTLGLGCLLIGAALTPETSEWLGGWADGLITAGKKTEDLRRVVDAFHRGGGEGKPMFLQAALSFAPTDEEAVAGPGTGSVREKARIGTSRLTRTQVTL